MNLETLESVILALVKQYAEIKYAPQPFIPGVSTVPVSGKVIGEEEMSGAVLAALEGWLTTGAFNRNFEAALSRFTSASHVLTTNSGSSANLLAISALSSPKLKERKIQPGDEVITVAAGFPTTVNPIIQNQLVPVFVDVNLQTYNIDVEHLSKALSHKTKALFLAHTLGNPFDLTVVTEFCKQHGLWLIEDCCDALGSTYEAKSVGSFGDLATLSFYPAHHITTGEGGAVMTNTGLLKRIVESFRDWGRDCYCEPGHDNSCKKRFGWKLGKLPFGYDHKYIYSHAGYNLKMTDFQAAIGVAQMGKLAHFIDQRKKNFGKLFQLFSNYEDLFFLPQATAGSDPSWFGFPLTLRKEASIDLNELLTYFDQKKIGVRRLFGGNLLRQPYFSEVKYRVASTLENTETIVDSTFWLGVCPAITDEMIDWVGKCLRSFVSANNRPMIRLDNPRLMKN